MDKKHDAETILQTLGLRITTARLRVLSIIISVNSGVPFLSIKRRAKGTNSITLYKTLKTLEKKGAVYRIFDLRGTAYYALGHLGAPNQQHRYTHFHCSDCRKMFVSPLQEPFKISLPKRFKARMFVLYVWGKCGLCGKKGIPFNRLNTFNTT